MSDNPNPTTAEQESQEDLRPYTVIHNGGGVALEDQLNDLHKLGYRHVDTWTTPYNEGTRTYMLLYRDEALLKSLEEMKASTEAATRLRLEMEAHLRPGPYAFPFGMGGPMPFPRR